MFLNHILFALTLACSYATYGEGCNQNCSCDDSHTTSCDHITGECGCNPGYSKPNCSTGKYLYRTPMSFYTCIYSDRCNDEMMQYMLKLTHPFAYFINMTFTLICLSVYLLICYLSIHYFKTTYVRVFFWNRNWRIKQPDNSFWYAKYPINGSRILCTKPKSVHRNIYF